jgi:TonB-dependent receptor
MRRFLLLLLVVFLYLTVFSQSNGVISGNVKDKTEKRGLPGATLKLNKQNRYTISDQNGHYEFLNVPEGEYQIEVSYIGYSNKVVTASVSAKNKELDIYLDEQSVELNGVVVMGDMLRSQSKALNTQKTNSNITNIISSDQVGRFPDSNIGDALKRVPGITMQNDQGEARNIIIRGLASELNSVTLNGTRIPSAEGDNRKVQMDLIPSDMVQSIEVNKTLTPDMDADAIGGSVNLRTRGAGATQRISATILGGYNPIREGLTGGASFVYGNRLFDKKLGILLSGSYQNKDYGSDNIEAVWKQDDNGNTYIEEMDIRKYDVQRIRRSGSLNLDWKINQNNTLYADLMYNWRDDRENRFRTRYRDIEPVYNSNDEITGYTGNIRRQTKGGIDNDRNKNRRLEDQRVVSYALSGQHLVSSKLDIDWNVNYSKASEDRPNERYIEYQQKDLSLTQNLSDGNLPWISAAGEKTEKFKLKELTENHDYTAEDEMSAKINARIPLSLIEDQKGRLRFGLRLRVKSKSRDNILYEYSPVEDLPVLSEISSSTFSNALTQGSQYVPGTFVSAKYLGSLNLNDASLFESEAAPSEYLSNNYDASERVMATYLRWDQNLSKKLLMIVGARLEHTFIKYTGNYIIDEDFDNVQQLTNDNSYLNVLPGVTLKYDVNNNFVLRAAFTTALARPNYYALVPYSNVESESAEISAGNPNLKATYSYNFDLMAEYYFKSVGVISGGVFYKNMKNFVYTYANTNYYTADFANDFPGVANPIPTGERWTFTQPLNGDNVDIYGFELAIQRKLDFMPTQFFRNFNVYANYTYTNSITKGIYNSDGEERTDVKLPGTAPHMFNGSLSWENKRLSVRVSANYTGSYIDEVTDEAFNDRYYSNQLFVDANASYKISSTVRIFAEANNLTNQALRYYQGDKNRMMQLEYYKPTFNLGVKLDL